MSEINKTNIELYYEQGKIPDRYYKQLNGKSAGENYTYLVNSRNQICDSSFLDSVAERIVDDIVKDLIGN